MIVKINQAQMEAVGMVAKKIFMSSLDMNGVDKIVKDLKSKATMQEGDEYYFDLDDITIVTFTYEFSMNWNMVKLILFRPEAFDPNEIKVK